MIKRDGDLAGAVSIVRDGEAFAIPYPAAAMLKFCANEAEAEKSPLTILKASSAAGIEPLMARPYPRALPGFMFLKNDLNDMA